MIGRNFINYNNCSMNDFNPKSEYWKLLVQRLELIIENNSMFWVATNNDFNKLSSKFNSIMIPRISIYSYLERIHDYSDCSDSCYVIAAIYIDRVVSLNPSFIVNKRNVHKLLLASILIAVKYQDDAYENNESYSMIGGVSLNELNDLELTIIRVMNSNIFVHPEEYSQYASRLCSELEDSTPKTTSFEDDKEIMEEDWEY